MSKNDIYTKTIVHELTHLLLGTWDFDVYYSRMDLDEVREAGTPFYYDGIGMETVPMNPGKPLTVPGWKAEKYTRHADTWTPFLRGHTR
ncbi:MAG: hypothetical protein HN350_11790 [Phycisphaerales bacterium]|jgi:hypothetical protein|nr:hypothetical protein [Phycisphaerales bacterium]